MDITDSQVLIWGPNSAGRPWPSHFEENFEAPFSIVDARTAMDSAGVTRAVLVTPAWEHGINDITLAAACADPSRFAVMGSLDMRNGRRTDLVAWRDQPGMLGVRLNFNLSGAASALKDQSCDWLFAEAGRLSIPIMLFAPGQELELSRIAASYPDTRIIVDHMNLRPSYTPEEVDGIVDRLCAMADLPNVAIKLSALPSFMGETYPYRSVHQRASRVIDAFGVDRCMWGSDMHRIPGTYAECVRSMMVALEGASEAERHQVMDLSVRTWIGWPPQPGAPR